MALPDIQNEVNDIYHWIQGLATKLHDLAYNSIVGLLPVIGSLVKTISDAANTILSKILTIGAHVRDEIAKDVGGLAAGAVNFIAGFIGTIAGDVHWLLGNLATAGEFAAGFLNEAAKHLPGFAATLGSGIMGGLPTAIVGVLKFIETQEPETVNAFLRDVLKLKSLPPYAKIAINGLIGRGAEWQAIALPIIIGVMIQPFATALAHPALIEAQQDTSYAFRTSAITPAEATGARVRNVMNAQQFYDELGRNNIDKPRSDILYQTALDRLQPEIAVRSAFRGHMSYPAYEQEMLERGITKDRASRIYDAMRPLMTEEDLRNAYLRGLLSESEHDERLARYGYDSLQIQYRKQLYFYIPGPDDLIRMAIRDVFTPEIVQKFDLFANFPPQFEQYAKMQGISKDWALRHWGAHWIVPSNTEAFEMFQRTTDASEDENADVIHLSDGTSVKNVIGRATLNTLLRQKDIAPYWRGKFTQIAYNPYTRIDVRRMHRVGILTKAQVERAYLDLGYPPDRARHLADFVEKLNTQEQKDQYRVLTDGLARRILTLYQQGKMKISNASIALDSLGLTPEESDFYIAEADLIAATDEAEAVETGVGKLYVGGFLTTDKAIERLKAAGATEVTIRRLFARWNLAVEFKELSADHVKARELTKSEIITAHKDGLISDDDTLKMLRDLGYDEFSAATELAVANYQQERDSRKAQIDAVKALYINNQRDYLTTSNLLDGLKMPTLQRDALLAEWTLTREQRVATIPIATVRDMVQRGFLTDDNAKMHLRRHKYNDLDIATLLEFWKLPAGARRLQSGPSA